MVMRSMMPTKAKVRAPNRLGCFSLVASKRPLPLRSCRRYKHGKFLGENDNGPMRRAPRVHQLYAMVLAWQNTAFYMPGCTARWKQEIAYAILGTISLVDTLDSVWADFANTRSRGDNGIATSRTGATSSLKMCISRTFSPTRFTSGKHAIQSDTRA